MQFSSVAQTIHAQAIGINVVRAANVGTSAKALKETRPDPGQCVICLMRRRKEEPAAFASFVKNLEHTVRNNGGKIQVKHKDPEGWDVHDGIQNLKPENHLSQPCFECDCIVVAVFRNDDDVHAWFSCDDMFHLLSERTKPLEKLSIHAVPGLLPGFDLLDQDKVNFGEKFILLELIRFHSSKDMQRYVMDFRRFADEETLAASRALQDGVAIADVKVLFADHISSTYMHEIRLDIATATMWRRKEDAGLFYESDHYQNVLRATREKYSECLTMLLPLTSDPRLPPVQSRGFVQRPIADASKTRTSSPRPN
mmetsp:Transcript_19762/g.44388  ORF Transcript_19762/g.44388 Transcript_19762/m.44388 type:complete len:311 (+) Transcript_19762:140-1072(+)